MKRKRTTRRLGICLVFHVQTLLAGEDRDIVSSLFGYLRVHMILGIGR